LNAVELETVISQPTEQAVDGGGFIMYPNPIIIARATREPI
jgi:hypothetical protein